MTKHGALLLVRLQCCSAAVGGVTRRKWSQWTVLQSPGSAQSAATRGRTLGQQTGPGNNAFILLFLQNILIEKLFCKSDADTTKDNDSERSRKLILSNNQLTFEIELNEL